MTAHSRPHLLFLILLLAGCPPGDVPDDDDSGDDDDAGDDDDSAPGDAREGYCAVDEVVGRVYIQRYGLVGPTYVEGRVWDRPDPMLGTPGLSNQDCDFHHHDTSVCGRCAPDEVCSFEGTCVERPQPRTEATLRFTVDGVEQVVEADESGLAWAQVEAEDPVIGATLSWDGGEATMSPRALPGGEIAAVVQTEGDWDAPGRLTASWTDSGAGAFVSTVIPINHHIGGPTFTRCIALESDEGFTASAEMIDPLSVVTGLEFQGLNHEHAVAVQVDAGCVQLTSGTRVYANP